MTATCPCGQPARNGHLCRTCRNTLATILGELPALHHDLTITATRRDHIGPSSEVRTATLYPPLPFDPAAADHAHHLRTTVTTWVRWTVDTLDTPDWPRDQLKAMCGWLADHLNGITLHPASVEMLADLRSVRSRGNQLIDAPPISRIYTGPCPEVDDKGEHCGGQIWGWFHPDSHIHPPVQKCGTCEKSWPATDWNRLGQRILDEQARQSTSKRIAEQIARIR